jgi:XTP/dITP diphosphohydrolase
METDKRLSAFKRLLDIMDDLRQQCPWDRKQTLDSLRYLTIEETYELSDAILEKDMDEIKKELGDLMLHLVFYAKIGSEKNAFDIADVLNGISEKLVHRHPHIYGDVKVKDATEVADNWEAIKMKEKGRKSALSGVPKSLPAMVKAHRIQEKVKGVGFEWEEKDQVWDKVKEEQEELRHEVKNGADHDKMEDEMGDLFFALINYARYIGVNPEDALERTNKKFMKRFLSIEQQAEKEGKSLKKMTLEEMDKMWDNAKKAEKPSRL